MVTTNNEEQKQEVKKKVLKRVVAARLVIFAAVVIWVCGWLMAALGLMPILFPFIWEGHLTSAHPMQVFMFVWFVCTFILIGVWAAVKGFKFVGRWEKE